VLPEIELLSYAARTITDNQADADKLVQHVDQRSPSDRQLNDDQPRAWRLTILRNTNISRPVAGDPNFLTALTGRSQRRPRSTTTSSEVRCETCRTVFAGRSSRWTSAASALPRRQR